LLSRLPKNAHILDVGGGPGTYAEAFVKDGARVTIYDLPEVIKLMKEHWPPPVYPPSAVTLTKVCPKDLSMRHT